MKRWLLLLLFVPAAAAQEVVATVDGQPITDRDIVRFAQKTPQLAGYLAVPGGPMRLLRQIIEDRLLLLEGERLGIPRPGDGDDLLYLQYLQKELVQQCPPPSAAEVRQFFDDHIELFSTPLMLRLSRIGLRSTPENTEQVSDDLAAIKQQIESGERDFAAVADQISDDLIGQGRGGDIGFIAIDVDTNPLFKLFVEADPERVIGPVLEQDMLYLYRVTDRREPIAEEFERVRDQAEREYFRVCREKNLDALMAELRRRWPVSVLVDDISIRPERRR